MRKLWVIGDSFSSKFYEPQGSPDSWNNRYCDYKGPVSNLSKQLQEKKKDK